MDQIRSRIGWIAVTLALVALVDYLWIVPANQTYAKRYLNESIVLSASTYATCRVINGGVSSLQESSISISPWGVGLEYEAGQILDPINDAVERLSEACVHSMAYLVPSGSFWESSTVTGWFRSTSHWSLFGTGLVGQGFPFCPAGRSSGDHSSIVENGDIHSGTVLSGYFAQPSIL